MVEVIEQLRIYYPRAFDSKRLEKGREGNMYDSLCMLTLGHIGATLQVGEVKVKYR